MKPPAFQFYPAEFLADENVAIMDNREIGCYVKLMCFCWREGSIPADIKKIARLCGESATDMAELWLAIGKCFDSAIGEADRLVHPRLEKERIKQEERRKERSDSGKRGANSKWNNALANDGNDGLAMAQPMANDGSSSSSSSSSSIINTNRGGQSKKPVDKIPYQQIVDTYHAELPMCPRVRELTEKRKGYIRARWKSGALPDLDTWQKYFCFCRQSAFLTGQTDPIPGRQRFVATLEWLTTESNYVKVIERKYHGGV